MLIASISVVAVIGWTLFLLTFFAREKKSIINKLISRRKATIVDMTELDLDV